MFDSAEFVLYSARFGKLTRKTRDRGENVAADHIDHCQCLDVDDLAVVIKYNVASGRRLDGGVDLVLCEEREVLLGGKFGNAIGGRGVIGKSADLGCLFYPSLVVAVSAEDDALVLGNRGRMSAWSAVSKSSAASSSSA